MATVANQYDPNNPNANSNTGGGGTVMPSSSGGSASVASGSGSGGTSSPAPSGTPYQPPNVSQYLAANQGAGQQLTQGITNNVQNQANQLNSQVNTSQNQLNSQYQPLNNNLNSNTANNVTQSAFQNPQQLLDAYNAAKTSSSSQPLSSDQQAQADQYNQFQQLNNGGYNSAIQSYGNQAQQANGQLQNQLGALTQQTGSANNEMGRNQLLQNAVGQGGNYNQGEQTLDSLFLQGSPGQPNANGLSNLQQLQQNLGGIGNQSTQNVQGLNLDAQNKLAALQGLSASDKANIQNLFLNGGQGSTGGLNQIGQDVQTAYGNLQNSSQAAQDAMTQAFQNGNYTPDQLKALGLTQGQQTWGVTGNQIQNLSGYQANPLSAYSQGGAAQAASPEEFARYNALNQLAGGGSAPAQQSVFGSATQAGNYNPYTVATPQAVQSQIQQNQQQYGVTDVQQLMKDMMGAGYTAGQSGGSGMRSADPGAPYRQAMGSQFNQLLNEKNIDPNTYYGQVVNAVNNSWGGAGLGGPNPLSTLSGEGSLYGALQQYGKELNQISNQRVGAGGTSSGVPNTDPLAWAVANPYAQFNSGVSPKTGVDDNEPLPKNILT